MSKKREELTREANVISHERFPVKRAMVMNKQTYNAAQLAKMMKGGNYLVPYSRRPMTRDEVLRAMHLAGKRIHPEALADYGPNEVPKYEAFVSRRTDRRAQKTEKYYHKPGSVQYKERRRLGAKVGKLFEDRYVEETFVDNAILTEVYKELKEAIRDGVFMQQFHLFLRFLRQEREQKREHRVARRSEIGRRRN